VIVAVCRVCFQGNSSTGAVGKVAVIQEGVADAVDSSLLGLGRAALTSKSTKPRVPENFNNLPAKPRLKALKQVCVVSIQVATADIFVYI